ncbi:MAG: hypothetical protein ABSB40_03615 [Nitrososphaeria archaeon]|jgi:hypothetical protein
MSKEVKLQETSKLNKDEEEHEKIKIEVIKDKKSAEGGDQEASL